MKKLIILFLLIFTVAIAQETPKEKFLRMHHNIQSLTYDLDLLFQIHENGFPRRVVVIVYPDTLDFSFVPTGQQKSQLRNLMRQTVDLMKLKADTLRAIFP